MSLAFSDGKFDAASYSDYRPSYGSALYVQLLAYHRGAHLLAIDIGCGTGQITQVIARSFDRVIGFDVSGSMINNARLCDNVEYRIASAESIPLDDESVDLVTVGQAAHWFDHDRWFKEMHRILKQNGTLSFWNYNEPEFTDSGEATSIASRYSHDAEGLGPHWPQPGRRILESAMTEVQPPEDLFSSIERHFTMQNGSKTESPVKKEIPLNLVEAYFRTSSAYHNWQAANQGRRPRSAGGGGGDIIDEMFDEIREATGWDKETLVRVHWPTIALLARKR